MSFILETKEKSKNINEEKNTNTNKEMQNNKFNELDKENNLINENNNIKKKKINLTIKNTFEERKKNFHINRDTYKRLIKNRTHGELKYFRNNSSKKIRESNKEINTLYNLHNYSKNKLNLNQTFGYRDKEQIKSEIYIIKNEIKNIDEELNSLKIQEEEAKNKFMANKIIIEKLLSISQKDEDKINNEEKQESNKNDKNLNEKGSFGSFYVTQINNNDNTKDETKEDNNNEETTNEKSDLHQNKNSLMKKNRTATFIQKKKTFERVKYIKIKNRIKVNNFNRLVLTLKREISDYDKSIESTSKFIETKKNDKKVGIFLSLNSFIDNKNKTLEELNSKRNNLSDILNNDNQKISLIILKTKKMIDEHKKAEKSINQNKTISDNYTRDKEYLTREKEILINEIKNAENEKSNVMKTNEEKEEERKKLENELKKDEDIYNEKTKNEKELHDIINKEISIKKIIGKNELNINKFKNNIKDNENKIQNYIKTNNLLKDYINITQQIKDLKKKETKITENNQEISKEILSNKLKKLSDELTEKNEVFDRLKKELIELQKEYDTKLKNINQMDTDYQKKENQIEIDQIKIPNNIDDKSENKVKNDDKKDCFIF
jgi:hypothetical protein